MLRTLYTLPEGDQVCHGDFHPGNVLMTPQGLMLIDWMDATRGNPLADVARTSLLLRIPELHPMFRRWVIAAGRSWFHAAYLGRYRMLAPFDERDLATWQPVIAAARLREEVPGEADRLLKLVKAARV